MVVGVGSIGERHLRCFLSTGRARVSFCEINDALRERIAQTYDVTRCYPDLESALDGGSNDGDVHGGFSHGEGSHDGDSHDGAGSDRAFDAAVVAVPAHLHIAVARELAEAGLHLLIENRSASVSTASTRSSSSLGNAESASPSVMCSAIILPCGR